MKWMVIAGARPNFMKVAPLMWNLQKRRDVSCCLVHTGQHYDEKMSNLFFRELNIPRPTIDLGVGSGSHAVQTAEVMKRIEPVILQERPTAMVVVGDVNSTIACALTAVKLGVPVAHVEAGLRSFDRTMPEEINRILTDAISQWLFVSERTGMQNLAAEGIPPERMFFVGNIMIDTLIAMRPRFAESNILSELGLRPGGYAAVTLHRPSNVDDPEVLGGLIRVLVQLQREVPVVFPVHPRTRKALDAIRPAGLGDIRLVDPLGYIDFMKLIAAGRLVLTDSGGIQEETTALGVPCLTLRANTERPATVEEGTNTLVGQEPETILAACKRSLESPKTGRVPELWDGDAASRIVGILLDRCRSTQLN